MLRRMQTIAAVFLILVLPFPRPLMAAFTLEDEKKLGREFHEKLDKAGVILRDDRVTAYVADIGNRLVAHADKVSFDFRFSVIKSSAINAFATPGGYVYVNRGLINMCEHESELAGVLAHEIAHVNARHIADSIAKSQKLSIAALAGMLAGAFLGGGGDLSAALIGFSYASAASLHLRYSREHEEEADRLGMMYLARTGYDVGSMLDFLRTMRRYEFYSNSIPSYFLTHPGTDERLRYLDALTQTTYREKGTKSIVGNFKRIQTLLLLGTKDHQGNIRRFKENLKKNPQDIDDLYGLAVTEERLGNAKEAVAVFQQALAINPQDRDVLRDFGVCLFKMGRTDQAVYYLQESLRLDPTDPMSILYLGRAYEARGEIASALATLKILEGKNIDDEELLYNLAVVYGKANKLFEAHYSFGMYFKKKNRNESALFHFKEALKYAPSDDRRVKEIEQELSALDKKGKSPKKKQ
ncbi:MAG: M48 family metalloprotease [Syntrophales bacterium]|nr:M48 family metalloprotease [Syntrophales bacterium]